MQFYSQYLKDFDNAKTKEQKGLAANTLKTQHATFLNIIIADIPQFQVDDYAVPSLPLFSLVATMHLTLLSDGIQRGKDWGYSDDNVETMRNQFKSKTSSSKRSVPGEHKRLQDILLPGSLMEEAIRRGVKAGVPAEVLDAWKDAYAALYKPGRAPDNGDEDLDYPTYAKKICTKRRGQVQLESGSNYQGYRDADNYRSCSDYDTSMVLNVLNYAEVWPFMAGDTWTANAIRNVDREIFYGPYRRWAGGASWDTSNPPPITNRGDNITSIIVRGWDDIDGLQVKHGSSWDRFQGNDSGGIRKQIDMIYDEYVNSVSITDGFKLGKLTFKTNYGNTVSNGSAAHATTLDVVDPPGYGLTSVIITQWSGDSPTGCDGVILGFRPLITDASRMD